MNERIRELIEQAYEQKPVVVLDPETCQPTHKIGNGGVPMYHSELNPEKFAALIVRECCVVMFADPRLRDVRSATRGCARSIKEHFGVEE